MTVEGSSSPDVQIDCVVLFSHAITGLRIDIGSWECTGSLQNNFVVGNDCPEPKKIDPDDLVRMRCMSHWRLSSHPFDFDLRDADRCQTGGPERVRPLRHGAAKPMPAASAWSTKRFEAHSLP
jgi:hypothetical protein